MRPRNRPRAGLGDRVEKRRVAPAALLLGAASLGAVLLAGSTPAIVAGVVLFAAGLLSFLPVMQAYLMDRLPTWSMGGDLGAMRSVYISVGATGPTVVGAVADASSFGVAFTALAGCLLASAVLVRSSTRRVDAG